MRKEEPWPLRVDCCFRVNAEALTAGRERIAAAARSSTYLQTRHERARSFTGAWHRGTSGAGRGRYGWNAAEAPRWHRAGARQRRDGAITRVALSPRRGVRARERDAREPEVAEGENPSAATRRVAAPGRVVTVPRPSGSGKGTPLRGAAPPARAIRTGCAKRPRAGSCRFRFTLLRKCNRGRCSVPLS